LDVLAGDGPAELLLQWHALVETEPAFALHLLRELARRLVEARATA